jgi:hypothetical protein
MTGCAFAIVHQDRFFQIEKGRHGCSQFRKDLNDQSPHFMRVGFDRHRRNLLLLASASCRVE